jgi:hypothetical protein
MGLFEGLRKGTPSRDELLASGFSEGYVDWLATHPAPGEVFIDTGEPTAEESRKLVAHLSEGGWELLYTAARATVQAALGEAQFLEEDPAAYEARITALQIGVDGTLHDAGVDPRTFLPLNPAA